MPIRYIRLTAQSNLVPSLASIQMVYDLASHADHPTRTAEEFKFTAQLHLTLHGKIILINCNELTFYQQPLLYLPFTANRINCFIFTPVARIKPQH